MKQVLRSSNLGYVQASPSRWAGWWMGLSV